MVHAAKPVRCTGWVSRRSRYSAHGSARIAGLSTKASSLASGAGRRTSAAARGWRTTRGIRRAVWAFIDGPSQEASTSWLQDQIQIRSCIYHHTSILVNVKTRKEPDARPTAADPRPEQSRDPAEI